MNKFPDQVVTRLEALARVGEAITTDEAYAVLGVAQQKWHRLGGMNEDFPKRTHIGRKFWVSPQALLRFVEKWNRMATGLTITQLAQVIHSTVPTTRRMTRHADFPKPVGEINGKPRWDRDEIAAWHGPRVDGAKLPASATMAQVKGRKKVKGIRNGKAKEKRADA